MQTFQAGKTYQTRMICDSACIVAVTIASRTDKMVKTTAGKSLRIFTDYSGNEAIRPLGRYSMAPIISA